MGKWTNTIEMDDSLIKNRISKKKKEKIIKRIVEKTFLKINKEEVFSIYKYVKKSLLRKFKHQKNYLFMKDLIKISTLISKQIKCKIPRKTNLYMENMIDALYDAFINILIANTKKLKTVCIFLTKENADFIFSSIYNKITNNNIQITLRDKEFNYILNSLIKKIKDNSKLKYVSIFGFFLSIEIQIFILFSI